jgi:cobalt-zinc-cadmium efflux system outer membrane protein
MRRGDVLSTVANEGQGAHRLARQTQPQKTFKLPPIFGPLELPSEEDESPVEGLTLEQAIARLIVNNHELRNKYFEIPQARADVITANLRANPLWFGGASNLPYSQYSPQRPGQPEYGGTLIYPMDISHKREARTVVARLEVRVLESQYQDAVRQQIDILHSALLEVLAARETLRYATASKKGLDHLARLSETQFQGKAISRPDYDRILIQSESAQIAVEQATTELRLANHHLGLLLDYRPEASDDILINSRLRAVAPPLPPREELIAMAVSRRPDINAYRLGVQRAESDVRLAEAEKTADVFALYTPYNYQNNHPIGDNSVSNWSLALFGSIPLFNRNQGNIRRAQLNVSQTRSELGTIEHHITVEVGDALDEYQAAQEAMLRIERTILPRSIRIRDASLHLLEQGEASALDFLNVQREHTDVVRQYRDALIRRRRAMLRLNTVVGQRILP